MAVGFKHPACARLRFCVRMVLCGKLCQRRPQPPFLLRRELFHQRLDAGGFAAADGGIKQAHFLRLVHAGEFGAAPGTVCGKALVGAVADAAIERAAAAQQQIHALTFIGSGSSGQLEFA